MVEPKFAPARIATHCFPDLNLTDKIEIKASMELIKVELRLYACCVSCQEKQ